MDDPVPLPVISVEDAPGTALIMLPGVNMDDLEHVSFETADGVLEVTCFYDQDGDQFFEYDVEITDSNRETIESMERLAVMNPSDVEPRKLTSDPEKIKELEEVMQEVKTLTEDDSESGEGDFTENGQNEVL